MTRRAPAVPAGARRSINLRSARRRARIRHVLAPEVVEPLGDGAERRRRVVDNPERPVLAVCGPAEVVRRTGDVRSAFLPPASAVDRTGAVDGVEDRARRRVHTTMARVRVARIGEVPLTELLYLEGRVVRLVPRLVPLEHHRGE